MFYITLAIIMAIDFTASAIVIHRSSRTIRRSGRAIGTAVAGYAVMFAGIAVYQYIM